MSRDKLSIVAAAVAAGVLLLAVLAPSPAGALACNNCVDTTDIVPDTLNSGDIGTGAVRSPEIGDGQVYSADIANGAVATWDLHPNARPAVGIAQLTSAGIAAGTTGAFDSFTVTAPAAGQLLVRVEGAAYVDLNNAGASATTTSGTIALCTVSGSVSTADCGDAIYYLWTQDADNADNNNETDAFTLVRQFSVAAGAHTYYLNGSAGSSAVFLWGGSTFNGATAVVQFFPGTLTVTS